MDDDMTYPHRKAMSSSQENGTRCNESCMNIRDFKDSFEQYFNKDSILRYYLFDMFIGETCISL